MMNSQENTFDKLFDDETSQKGHQTESGILDLVQYQKKLSNGSATLMSSQLYEIVLPECFDENNKFSPDMFLEKSIEFFQNCEVSAFVHQKTDMLRTVRIGYVGNVEEPKNEVKELIETAVDQSGRLVEKFIDKVENNKKLLKAKEYVMDNIGLIENSPVSSMPKFLRTLAKNAEKAMSGKDFDEDEILIKTEKKEIRPYANSREFSIAEYDPSMTDDILASTKSFEERDNDIAKEQEKMFSAFKSVRLENVDYSDMPQIVAVVNVLLKEKANEVIR